MGGGRAGAVVVFSWVGWRMVERGTDSGQRGGGLGLKPGTLPGCGKPVLARSMWVHCAGAFESGACVAGVGSGAKRAGFVRAVERCGRFGTRARGEQRRCPAEACGVRLRGPRVCGSCTGG